MSLSMATYRKSTTKTVGDSTNYQQQHNHAQNDLPEYSNDCPSRNRRRKMKGYGWNIALSSLTDFLRKPFRYSFKYNNNESYDHDKKRKNSSKCYRRTWNRCRILSLLGQCMLLSVLVYSCTLLVLLHKDNKDSQTSNSNKQWMLGRGISNLADLGYKSHPQILGYYFSSISSSSNGNLEHNSLIKARRSSIPIQNKIQYQKLPKYLSRHQRHRTVQQFPTTREFLKRQEHLKNSKDYWYGSADPQEVGDCIVQHPWQKFESVFPSCNLVHEVDMLHFSRRREELYYRRSSVNAGEALKMVANGYWRDVWLLVNDYNFKSYDQVVLKTIRYEHDFEERNYDRHRRDSVVMEQLTQSPYVVDIYGHCGNSGLFEYSSDGDLDSAMAGSYYGGEGEKVPTVDKLRAAVQVARGIADAHGTDKGLPIIAHSDIVPGQFILINGVYKLNDFNRCRFLNKNKYTNELCGYHVGNNPGKFRSPEEYKYEDQTEKIDIYSMGNVFYYILTGMWPFQMIREKAAQEKIMEGERPKIDKKFRSSNDTAVISLIKAMEKCWAHIPNERPSARQVEIELSLVLAKVEDGLS